MHRTHSLVISTITEECLLDSQKPTLVNPGPFLVAVLIAVILNPLNSSTISVALGVLLHHFQNGTASVTWIISGYYLGSAIAQPVFGRLGDLWGHRPLIYIGLALIILTAVFAPLSPTLTVFVIWRVIQAVGTSMIYPNAIALVRYGLPDAVGRVLGWIGMAAGIAIAVGPTIGGVLMSVASWHAIFWVNIPLALVAGVLFFAYSPMLPSRPRGGFRQLGTLIDWPGLGLFATTVSMGLVWAVGLESGRNALAILYAGILFVGLIAVELKTAQPLIPLKWFLQPKFLISSILTTLSNIVMYGILYGLPVSVQNLRHLSPKNSGLLLLAFAGVMTVASPWGGHMAQKKARRKPLIAAGVFLAAGTSLLLNIRSFPWALIIMGLMLVGLSFALSNVLLQQSVLESVPASETGRASGLFMLIRYLGTIISSVLIAFSTSASTHHLPLFFTLFAIAVVTALLPLLMTETAHGPS